MLTRRKNSGIPNRRAPRPLRPKPPAGVSFRRGVVTVGTAAFASDASRTAFAAFCVDRGIDTIYLDLFALLGNTNYSTANVAIVQDLVSKYRAAGASRKAYGMFGAMDWSKPSVVSSYVLPKIVQKVQDYNTASSALQKLDGFLWNIDYWNDGTQTATQAVSGYAGMLASARTQSGLEQACLLPAFLADATGTRASVTYGSKTQQDGKHLIDAADSIVVQAFANTGSGQIALFDPWATYAASVNAATIYCEALATDTGGGSTTYYDNTVPVFEAQQDVVRNAYKTLGKFKGVVVHNYADYSVGIYPEVPKQTAPAPTGTPRAMYLWTDDDPEPISTPQRRADVAAWCAARGVSHVWVDIRKHLEGPTNNTAKNRAKFRDLIGRLSAVGVEAWALTYKVTWMNPSNTSDFTTNCLQAVLDYNAAVNTDERVVGIHLDEEFWINSAGYYPVGTYPIATSLSQMKAIATAIKNAGLKAGCFTNSGIINGTTYTVDGVTKTQGDHLISFFNQVEPGCYLDDGVSSYGLAQKYVDNADAAGGTTRVWCAVEVMSLGLGDSAARRDRSTYYGVSRAQLERELQVITDHFAGNTSYKGNSIHSYGIVYTATEGWRGMTTVTPPVELDFLNPVTPALGDPSGGGRPVTVKGKNFVAGVPPNMIVVVVNNTTATCVPPAKSAGLVDIGITLPGSPAGQDDSGGIGGFSAYEYWSVKSITNVDLIFDSFSGVTQSGGAISQWVDQTANAVALTQATGANQPVAATDANGIPVVRMAKGKFMSFPSFRAYASGVSVFAVVAHSSTDTTVTNANDVPLTVLGGSSASNASAFGYSGAKLAWQQLYSSATHLLTKVVDWTLNNGQPWLAGWTYATTGAGNLKAYVGTNQSDSAVSGTTTYDTTNTGFDRFGTGRDNTDGIDGDVYLVLVVSGVITAANRIKLHKWCQQRYGVNASNS